MLNHFKNSLTHLLASGKKRGETARVRNSLERLEERTMLSASRGAMAYNFRPPAGVEPQKFGNTAAFAPPHYEQQSLSYNAPPFAGKRDATYRGLQVQHPTQPEFQPWPEMNVGQVWMPREFDYPSQTVLVTSSQSSYSPYDPYYNSVTMFAVEYVATNTHETLSQDPSPKPGTNGSNPLKALGQNAHFGGPSQSMGEYPDLQRFAQQVNRQTPPQIDFISLPNGPTIPLGSVLASITSTKSELPSASPILARESTTSSALNAVAREVAFQELASSLFQSNAAAAYDRAGVESLGRDATSFDGVDAILHPTDESTVEIAASSSDTVAREREAVDAVLEELHDIDLLSPTTESHDLTSKANLQSEAGLDDLPAGEVDGGMVLLKSTGDANGSGFDLTQVYADQVARFRAPTKMETSVGMFQAIDVATDEAPMTEPAPRTESTSVVKPVAESEEQISTKHEQKSSTKSAAVITAATAAGAMVWLNRSGSRPDEKKSTAQIRRAVCR